MPSGVFVGVRVFYGDASTFYTTWVSSQSWLERKLVSGESNKRPSFLVVIAKGMIQSMFESAVTSLEDNSPIHNSPPCPTFRAFTFFPGAG